MLGSSKTSFCSSPSCELHDSEHPRKTEEKWTAEATKVGKDEAFKQQAQSGLSQQLELFTSEKEKLSRRFRAWVKLTGTFGHCRIRPSHFLMIFYRCPMSKNILRVFLASWTYIISYNLPWNPWSDIHHIHLKHPALAVDFNWSSSILWGNDLFRLWFPPILQRRQAGPSIMLVKKFRWQL